MKNVSLKGLISLTLVMLSPVAIAFADLCSDITSTYNQQILQLTANTNAALALTQDPAEQAAIRQSFQAQLAQLQMELQATLAGAGCLNTPPPTEPPPTDPGTPPTDPGNPPTDPGNPPTDPGNPPTDPGNPPPTTPPPGGGGGGHHDDCKDDDHGHHGGHHGGHDDDDDDDHKHHGRNHDKDDDDDDHHAGTSCREMLEAYGEQVSHMNVSRIQKYHLVQKKAKELGCSFGPWRSGQNHNECSNRGKKNHRPHRIGNRICR